MEPLKHVLPPKELQKPFYEDVADASEQVKRVRKMLANCYNATDSGPNDMYYLRDPTHSEIDKAYRHLYNTVDGN